MENPFVYGEVVPRRRVRRSPGRAEAPRRRPAGRPEGLPDLAAPLRQVVADPPRAGQRSSAPAASRSRSPSAATAPTSRSSRATRARCCRRRNALVARRVTWLREAIGATRPEVRLEADARRRLGRRRRLPGRPHRRATSRASRRRCSRCPARLADVRAPPRRRRARRVPGDRRVQRRQRRGGAARGGAASAPGRLRLRRLGAHADGGDARARSGRSTRRGR